MSALMGLLSVDTLGSLATINTLLLNVSPLSDEIPAIKRARTTGDRSPLLFVCLWANAMLWCEYGFFVEQVHPIVTTNLLGLVVGAYYLLIFYRYSNAANRSLFMNFFAVGLFMVVSMYLYAFVFQGSSFEVKRFRLGAMCCAVTVSMYAAPLSALKKALQARSNKTLSFTFSLLGTTNSIFWSGYGLLQNDPWVYSPNVLGAGCSILQLASWFYLNDNHHDNDDHHHHNYTKLSRTDPDDEGILMRPLRSASPGLA